MEDIIPQPVESATDNLQEDPVEENEEYGAFGETDHCRICRGEGTIEEPLFYPCKCNGSIRYVHQACLMQWLSHSQKKHCELCKTPFRFTKLYDPNMPTTVPWPVFVRQASIHTIRFTLKCARWLLVLFVWLGWVPWCMRFVWRGLFWIGDGSWITQQQLEKQSRAVHNTTATLISDSLISMRSPSIPGANSTLLGSDSRTLDLSSSEPLILWFGRRLLNTVIFPYSALANSTVEIRWVEGPPRNPSLLSNARFLKDLTRWRFVNDSVVDILEGQIITIGILVTFVLMFLIREWVVQQQPMINLGAALEGEAANPQPPLLQDPVMAEADDATAYEQNDMPVPDKRGDPLSDIATHVDNDLLIAPMSSDMEENHKESVEEIPLAPQWGEYDTIQPLSLRNNQSDIERRDTHATSILKSSTTPPESDIEDLDEKLLGSTSMNGKELGSLSSAFSQSQPAMPSKENITQATTIARALEESTHVPRETSHNEELTALGLADNSTKTQHTRSEDGISSQADVGNRNESHGETSDGSLMGSDPSQPSMEAIRDRPTGSGIIDWMWGDIPQDEHHSEDAISDWHTEAGSNIDAENLDHENDGNMMDLQLNDDEIPPPPAVVAPINLVNNPHPEPEVLRIPPEAAVEPNEVEQVEEGEDMDGVMELIGMQGPLAGLLQNGMFSTVIISMTVLFGIWLPYLMGKLVLIILANPTSLLIKMPLRWTSTIADLIVDFFIFFAGSTYYWLDRLVRITASPVAWALPLVRTAKSDDTISKTAYRLTWSAADRLAKNLALTGGYFSDSDIPVFSIVAHESLRSIQMKLYNTFAWVYHGMNHILEQTGPPTVLGSQIVVFMDTIFVGVTHLPSHVTDLIVNSLKNIRPNVDMLKINLQIPARSEPLKLSNWSSSDRVLTIILGYIFFASLGFVYLKVRKLFKEIRDQEQPMDGLLVDILNQSGGVSKVILIITIEMLAFPLYCGFLLDTALLPLFGHATVSSRMAFLGSSPWTSIFIHWFAGTCYMFHFALFVAMCRKILRPGVLYFIRDPDDPSFHPVRDVLERNVATQLRKILFSALVYGALVIVCLGAVVWSVSAVVQNIFPIHWSSNEPVLEFPADLLVYNFLMPLAVKAFKPSASLQDMYNWWFRKCARLLSLSHFLFDERNIDEEGWRLNWQSHSTKAASDFIRDCVERRHPSELDRFKKLYVRDGRLVRAPASDQVRIPKGKKTFVDVDSVTGKRKDGLPENPAGLHGKDNKKFSDFYIPPYFRIRIGCFIILIWAFAAFTGVTLTVIPLLFGRFIFSRLIQSHPRMNDVYAFAIGFYLLAGPVWLFVKYRSWITRLLHQFRLDPRISTEKIRKHLPAVSNLLLQSIRALYFYSTFMLLLPSLIGLIWEAYILIPLHTYFQRTDNAVPVHTVHFVSDWTLGVLFVRVAVHIMLKFPQSQPTKALIALVSPQNHGSSWWNPDIRLATRAFIIPSMIVSVVVLLLPLGLIKLLFSSVFEGLSENSQMIMYRYSYPIFMAIMLSIVLLRLLRRAINKWRSHVRDEVYLISERLHNFDEKRVKVAK